MEQFETHRKGRRRTPGAFKVGSIFFVVVAVLLIIEMMLQLSVDRYSGC